MINQIQDAIDRADRLKSKLAGDVLNVPGFTSVRIRHLMNNLGSMANNYLEIGVHKGGTFCSTCYDNKLWVTRAVDNFSEFNADNPRAELEKNIRLFCKTPAVCEVVEQDCWTLERRYHLLPTDLFLYDGDHSSDSQYKACSHFLPLMADQFIFCVDDYSAWPHVKEATQRGIKDAKLTVLFERELWNGREGDNDGWHNGFYVALIKK